MEQTPSFIKVQLMLGKDGRYSVGSAFNFADGMTQEDVVIYRELMYGMLYMASFEPLELRKKAQTIIDGGDMIMRLTAAHEEMAEPKFDTRELPDNVIPFPGPKRMQ